MLLGIVLGVLLAIGLLVVLGGVVFSRSEIAHHARIDLELRQAEHRLGQVAQAAFQTLLEEARRHGFPSADGR